MLGSGVKNVPMSREQLQTIYQPSLNVIDEIGQGNNLPTIILVEDEAEVPSNIQTRSTYITFSRENLSEMLITLMENMKSSGFT